MMTIEVDEQTAQALRELELQAIDREVALDVYLRELAIQAGRMPKRRISLEELESVLQHFSAGEKAPGMLPPDFNREDIYYDHD